MTVSLFSEATVSTSLTLGQVPLARMGPSLTLFNNKIYMFGGQYSDSRTVSNDFLMFDLDTLVWDVVPVNGSIPCERFLHSAAIFQNTYLVISGGSGYNPNGFETLPLNDICLFNFKTATWEILSFSPEDFSPRYAHLTCTVGNELLILGGQKCNKKYRFDIIRFNLETRQWAESNLIDFSIGTHVASICDHNPDASEVKIFYNPKGKSGIPKLFSLQDGKLLQEHPLSPNNTSLPPSFRFPNTHIIGSKLVTSGSFISKDLHSFGLWSLDSDTMTWSPIDTGSCFARGSWSRTILHSPSNRYIVFGHCDRDLGLDYSFRRINFTHINVVNLEAFGIFQSPASCQSSEAIQLGLQLINEPRFSNFALLTNDGFRIHANSGILKERWHNFDTFLARGHIRDHNALFLPVQELQLQESYNVVQCFVRYLYTNSLDFDEAMDLSLLGKLLIFSRNYSIAPLSDLVSFHLHRLLTIEVAPELFQYASLAQRDGLKLRCLALMIKERSQLAQDEAFWKTFPQHYRQEILNYMPPNFKSPYQVLEKSTPHPSFTPEVDYTLHFMPTDRGFKGSPRNSMQSVSPMSPTFSEMLEPQSPDGQTTPTSVGDDSLYLSAISEDPLSDAIPTKPRKGVSGPSFLKFSGRRPSLASFFNFSSAASASNIPPPSSLTVSEPDSQSGYASLKNRSK